MQNKKKTVPKKNKIRAGKDPALAIYLFKNRSKKGVVSVFSMVLILGLCFTILILS